MVEFFKSVYRYYKIRDLGALFAASMAAAIPFVAALALPVLLAGDPVLSLAVFFGGLVLTGQVQAVSGRLLDLRFRKVKPAKGTFVRAWAEGWAEGLVITLFLVGLFAVFNKSVPYYLAQGTVFAIFSLAILGTGTTLVLGFLPFFLPVRRREGLNLRLSIARSFRLMNANLALSAATAGLGMLSLLATVGSAGLFPGFGGLAALHQGVYELAVGSEGGTLPDRP